MIQASSERKLQVSLETRFITLLLESEEQFLTQADSDSPLIQLLQAAMMFPCF